MNVFKSEGILRTAWLHEEGDPKPDTPYFEARLKEVYAQFVGHGDTCIDVGVHKGDHLRELQRLGATVWGFEPCPTFWDALAQAKLYGVSNHALTSPGKTGSRTFCEDVNRPGWSGLEPMGVDPTIIPHQVVATTLDDCVRRRGSTGGHVKRIRFLKIDTEGHDVDVLEGAAWLISCDRPIIACEWFTEGYTAHGRQGGDLWDFAEDMGYKVGDLWGNLCGSREEFLEVLAIGSFWDWMLWPQWAVVAGIPQGLK